ncbi:MAG TPA: PQQ-binding-like beta-propeller repeat protein [Draconibacterium sp.]|nr:PQQ-binding-like beta-propeller repeat protein [Draconibacterium sp.]
MVKTNVFYCEDIYAIIQSNEQFLDVECELGGIFSTPVIHGNYMIITSTNGKLYCLEK